MNHLVKDQAVQAVACLAGHAVDTGLKEVLLVPWGTVESKRGRFLLDEEAVTAIVEAFNSHQTDLVIDWEHQTLGGEYATPSGRAPAAGWVKRVYWQLGQGLKGLVEWTEKAREAIRAGEYRYLSPVVLIRKSDNRAVGLHSAALTNVPAIPRMERLAASKRQENAMPEPEKTTDDNAATPDQKLKTIFGMLRERGIDVPAVSREAILDAVIAYLEGNAPGEDAEVASSVREVLGLEPDAGKDEVVLAMTTRDTGGAGGELTRMKEAEADRVARDKVNACVRDNKINPHDQRAMTAALSLAREHPDRFEAIMAGTVSNPPPGRTTPPDSRSRLMMLAAREYRGDEALKNTTSCEAYIDLKLRDGGFEPMSADESREFAKVV